MANGYRVSLTDEDVAGTVLAAADAAGPNGNWGLYRVRVVAVAVAAGRAIGKKEGLEPLDDGIRTVARAAYDELVNRGLVGITSNLLRLDAFLQRYPARGIADEAQEDASG